MIFLVLALQLWTLAFVGFFGSELLGSYPGLRIAAQIVFVAPLVVWAVLRLRGPRSLLDGAVLLALAAFLVVSLMSVDIQGSLNSLGLAVAYALTFFAMRDVGSHPRLRTAVAVAGSYALVFWLVMIAIWWVQEKVAWISVFGSVPNLDSNQVFIWGTANAFPILSLLCLPLLGWQPAGSGRRILVVLWAVASIVAIPLSAGRAGWLGIVVAIVAYDGLSGWMWACHGWSWLRARRLAVAVVAAVGVGVIGVLAFVVTHFQAILTSALDGRGPIWQQAVAIFLTDPLTGGGPSTYSWLRLTHVPDYTDPIQVRLAHDVPLLTLADGGLILFAAFMVLLLAFAMAARRHVDDPHRRTALAVLVGFGAASLFDDFSSLTAVIAIVVTLAAWVVADEMEAPVRAPAAARLALPAALLIGALVVLPSVVGVDRARAAAADGRASAVAGDWPAALGRFQSAADAYPADAAYRLGLGLAYAETGNTRAAIDSYTVARQLSPGDARGWGALASLTIDREDRIRLLDAADRRSSSNPQYAYRLGWELEAAGRHADAIAAWARAVIRDRQVLRQLASDPASAAAVHEVASEVAQIVDGFAPAAGISPDAVRSDLALLDGTLGGNVGAPWRAVYLANQHQPADARAAVNDALRAAPYDRLTLRSAQAVARMTCDENRYEQLTTLIGPFRPERPAKLSISREHIYREDALSSYDPPGAVEHDVTDKAWPWSLLGDPSSCPGWPAP
jgi:tetratricopeptide (TPR) repeat protein